MEEKILRDAYRSGMPVPDRIRDAPSLLPGLGLYYGGFMDLVSSRPIGVSGPGPIPWTAVEAYCRALDLDEEQADDMHYFVTKLDAEWLRHQQERSGG